MKLKGIIVAALIVLGGLSLSSCNRGYGCPTWSIDTITAKVVTQAVAGLNLVR